MIREIAEHFGVEPGSVVRCRDEGAAYRVLIDYGIGGIKVHNLAKDDMRPATTTTTYDLDYRELQALAKEAGIPANQSKDDLTRALWPEGDEEE